MDVKFKKLNENAILPFYAKNGDAGLDLTAISVDDTNDNYIQYHTGLSVEIPNGYVGLIFPRSSVTKTNLMLGNSVGVIDSGYRGEILVRFKKILTAKTSINNPVLFNSGDAIAQLIILPYPIINPIFVDELTVTERGTGGFGHSDKKK